MTARRVAGHVRVRRVELAEVLLRVAVGALYDLKDAEGGRCDARSNFNMGKVNEGIDALSDIVTVPVRRVRATACKR